MDPDQTAHGEQSDQGPYCLLYMYMQMMRKQTTFDVCLFLYVPVHNFSVILVRIFLSSTNTKQGSMCLAQGHKAVTPVRLETATPQSQVKHSI